MNQLRSLQAAAALLVAASAHAQSAADVEAGLHAFMAAGCYQCHGTVGQGGVGPRLAPGPLPPQALIAFVRYSAGNMPAYSPAVISDDDLERIAAYLRSIKPTMPVPRKSMSGH
jgi:ubiquinol-cytochrome c reductase cytochrome c subunit